MDHDTFPQILTRPDGSLDTDRYVAIAQLERRAEMTRFFKMLRSLALNILRESKALQVSLARPHGAHNGKTSYEALREKL